MEGKFKKDVINIIKGVLPAVFCIVIAVVAVNTGGADIKELPTRVEAAFETPVSEVSQAPEVLPLSNNDKEKTVKKNKKVVKKKVKNKKNNVNIKNLQDGTFTGIGTGFGGDIKSLVTIDTKRCSYIPSEIKIHNISSNYYTLFYW